MSDRERLAGEIEAMQRHDDFDSYTPYNAGLRAAAARVRGRETDVRIREDDPRIQVVTTGVPNVDLLACTRCGVLLWDVYAHYADLHPDRPASEHE